MGRKTVVYCDICGSECTNQYVILDVSRYTSKIPSGYHCEFIALAQTKNAPYICIQCFLPIEQFLAKYVPDIYWEEFDDEDED